MSEITLKPSRSQHQVPEQQSRLEIEWNTEAQQFRVKVNTTYYGWFADTPSNRKAVVVLLREMYDSETADLVAAGDSTIIAQYGYDFQ